MTADLSGIDLYYTAPSDAVFEEIKAAALTLWRGYADEPASDLYVAEKVGRVEPLTNVSDNWMYMVAMFDLPNQMRLFARLSAATRGLILRAMR